MTARHVSLLVLFFVTAALILALTAVAPAAATSPSAGPAIAAQLRADAVPTAAWAVVHDGQVSSGARGDGVDDMTPFVLGSISKSFTALAVMQLVDAGRIQLAAPVTHYLPGFRTADPARVITVEQLLHQTSGLPTSAGTVLIDHADASLEQRVNAAAAVQPVSEPGQEFHYCNLNYAVLGRLIEQVSGLAYGDYVQQRVFGPLGMTGSYTSVIQARAHGLPLASTVWFGVTVPRATPDYSGGAPDGFLVSTAHDMARYLRFQLGDGTLDGTRLVSERSLHAMHTATVQTEPDVAAVNTDSYAMGWGVGQVNGHQLLAHDGDAIGYHSNLALFPAEQNGLVVLTARNGALTAANGPATAGVNVLAGQPESGPSHDVRTTYVVLDVVALSLLGLLGWSLHRGWRNRIAQRTRRYGRRRAVLLPIMRNLTIAAAVYVGFFHGLATAVVGFPVSLRFIFGFVGPDVTTLVVATSAFFVVRAFMVAIVAGRAARTP